MRARLPFLDEACARGTTETLTGQLLTTIYQSTRNSSAQTRAAARAVAEAVGAEHVELDVDPLVERYVALASEALGRPLAWSSDDVALQNIQARVRSPGAWLIANVKSALLLSTSNRSEAAVGYATMDGDTSGGLSPIAGVDKAFLRRWLRWVEQVGPAGLRPLPASIPFRERRRHCRHPDAPPIPRPSAPRPPASTRAARRLAGSAVPENALRNNRCLTEWKFAMLHP